MNIRVCMLGGWVWAGHEHSRVHVGRGTQGASQKGEEG